MGLPTKKLDQKFTYNDYSTWPDDERWELISGYPFKMSAAPNRFHQETSIEISRQISNFLVGKPCKVYYAPFDIRLPEEDQLDGEIDTVVQPDIVVVCDKTKLDDKGCKGAPDWIIEILSPFTALRDLNAKYSLYEKHGVKEYWIVDPLNEIITVYKLNNEKKFDRSGVFGNKDKIESGILQGLSIDLGTVFVK